MATDNQDIIARLNRARTGKPKKAYEGPKAMSDKKKAELEADKAAGKKSEPRKPIPKGAPLKKGGRSEKMRGVMAAIKPLYEDFLEKKPVCEINSPKCTQMATCVHHTKGRGVAQIMNIKTWKASCNACNGFVETNDEWARQNGHKISRHTKN
jgi:hypothetical protein